MHSVLRDRYKNLATISDILLLVSAIGLNSMVFVDYTFFESIFVSQMQFNLILGSLAVLVFTLSLVLLLVNWKQKAENHKVAVIQLSGLLNECRQIISKPNSEIIDSFLSKYNQINSMLVPIPDSKFNALKSRHLRKVEFSKFLDNNGHRPYWLVTIIFFLNSFRK